MSNESSLWVGTFLDGSYYVYDPDLQPRTEFCLPDQVFVYLVGESRARDYSASVLKGFARRVSVREAAAARAEYLVWSEKRRSGFVSSMEQLNAGILDRERIEREKVVEKHRQYLEGIGRKYRGVDSNPSRPPRTTHCYACKTDLDGKVHVACLACGWLICQCGACGCGYERT